MRLGLVWSVGAMALVLSGCSWFQSDPPPPCPASYILSDGANLTQFRPGQGRDLTDVEFEAQIASIQGGCKFDKDKQDRKFGIVTVRLNATITALRGAALGTDVVMVPFFVAVLDRQRQVLNKVDFEAKLDFAQGRRRAGVLEENEAVIEIEEGKTTRDYQVIVSMQLTEDQLQYNRLKKGE